MTAFIVLVAIVVTAAYIFTATASWFERAGQQLDALIDAALNDQATDFGEPTREQVEWELTIAEAVRLAETPIHDAIVRAIDDGLPWLDGGRPA